MLHLILLLLGFIAGADIVRADDVTHFRNDPPRIIHRDHPAILVTIDGEPALGEPSGGLRRVRNSPFLILLDTASRQYWLSVAPAWFTTTDLLDGTWVAGDPPAAVASQVTPTDDATVLRPEFIRNAEVIVATVPTELIATDGSPQYRSLVGDELLFVANTESDVFLEMPARLHYIVLSGRWFRSPALDGPWSFVAPDDLPRVFAAIPRESPKAAVLPHVPGTEEARAAVIDAGIPEETVVRRGMTKLDISYDGSPRFEQIPGTSLFYASNTASQVLKDGERYFAVVDGVWYVSDSAWGPWAVAEARPEQVAKIPPSSPAYNLRYVYIYGYTPEAVHTGFLPGYHWTFPYRGAIVYGTGYHYGPWIGPGYYFGRPLTWGFPRYYDPWYGFGWRPGWTPYYWGFSAFGPVGHVHRPPPVQRDPRRDVRPPPRTQIGTLPGIGGRPSARQPYLPPAREGWRPPPTTMPPRMRNPAPSKPPQMGNPPPAKPPQARDPEPARPPRATPPPPRAPLPPERPGRVDPRERLAPPVFGPARPRDPARGGSSPR